MKAENETKRTEMKKGKAVLALGEVTGHRHVTMQECVFKPNEAGLATELILEKPVELAHETHETIQLPKGKPKVVLQQEVDLLGEYRQVMD